jgi:hypothetical protein
MNTNHTKGDWKISAINKLNPTQRIIHKEQGFVIAKIMNIDEAEANAKLIAAAPDLLKALKSAQNILAVNYNTGTNEIDEAIEKATK